MEALQADTDWPLVFGGETWRTVPARDLWNRLMQATYDVAEPGVIFVDRVNAQNNLAHCETISASNPCGEQMLPPYGACLLGSINLARLVSTPFEAGAALDEDRLGELTRTAVRFLDNVIDVSRFPLEQQDAEAKAKRRLGLGVTGLADALVFCGVRYGTQEAADLTRRWLGTIKREAYRASAELAAEKGVFPLWDPAMLETPNLRSLDDETRALIATHGLRNGCLTSIAPTGTTSLMAGNVSSGVEPVFAYAYTRKVLQKDGSKREEAVEDYALTVWKRLHGDAPPPEHAFVTAQTLTPADHLRMQAAAQEVIASSISKTVNCPEDITFDAFADVYVEGWKMGCKGLTTYRPNAVTGSVLSTAPAPEASPPAASPARELKLSPRPEALPGATYKIKWPDSPHAVYVTLNDVDDGDGPRPFEIFINSKNMEHYAWTLGLTRMISAVFRRGGDVSFVAEELKAVFDPRGGGWLGGRYVPSLLAAIGGVIERHLERDKAMACEHEIEPAPSSTPAATASKACCPRCGAGGLVRKEGCDTCFECGYSKCG
jgi:ribonucleoside-diphosphate reductase alpha chain